MGENKGLEKVVYALGGILFGSLVYAMDWQRDQDNQMSGLRDLITQQRTLLQLQQQYQQNQLLPILPNSSILIPNSGSLSVPRNMPATPTVNPGGQNP